MAYSLDFSGWKDARNAMARSIINQANISANAIADRANVVNKTISSLLGTAAMAYGDYTKNKENEEMFDLAMRTGLIPETSGDFMQDLSSRNALTGDKKTDEEDALLFKKYLMKKYGF